jgi:NADH-quinone oxidoreductase subunit N
MPPTPPPLADELAHVSALAILLGASLGLLLTGSFAKASRSFQRPLALVAVAFAVAGTWPVCVSTDYDAGMRLFEGMLVVDHLSGFLDLLVLVAVAGTLALSHGKTLGHGEREPLLLLGAAAAILLNHAGDLIVVYLGLELLGVCSCALVLTGLGRRGNKEAAWHAFLGMAVTSAFLLLGIALLYAGLSSTQLGGMGGRAATVFNQWGAVQRYVLPLETGQALPAGLEAQFRGKVVTGMAPAALFVPGMLLFLAGLLGKLAVVPFHLHRGRVVEAAPSQVTAFVLTVEQIAVVAVLLRVFVALLNASRLVNEPYGWTGMLPTLAVATSAFAYLAALRQRNLARLVALFWMGAAGNVLLGIVLAGNYYGHRTMIGSGIAPKFETIWAQVAGDQAMTAVLLQLGAWVIAALGLMAVVATVEREDRPGSRLEEWAALARTRPGLGLVVTACLLSLVGMPPSFGFLGKWTLLISMLDHSGLRWLVVPVLLNLSLAAVACFRILAVVYSRSVPAGYSPGWHRRSARTAQVLGIACVALGVFGTPVIELARTAAAGTSLAVGHPRRSEWIDDERVRWARDAERSLGQTWEEAETQSQDADEPPPPPDDPAG